MLGIAVIGGISSLNANASKTTIKNNWYENNQKYNMALNGKSATFVNPSFEHKNSEIDNKKQLTKAYKTDTFLKYKIVQVIITNKNTKYYNIVSSISPNVSAWVYSKGLSKINASQNTKFIGGAKVPN